LESK